MDLKYKVIKVKIGWVVQNSYTWTVLSTHNTEKEALRVAKVLNGHA